LLATQGAYLLFESGVLKGEIYPGLQILE